MRLEDFRYTLNAGIFSPALAEREDTEGYYAAVRDGLNMRPVPEGGMDARGGLAHGGRMRGPVSELDLTNVTFTPNPAASLTGGGDTVPDPGGPEPDPPIYPGDTPGRDPWRPWNPFEVLP